jgi:hypothetical protein
MIFSYKTTIKGWGMLFTLVLLTACQPSVTQIAAPPLTTSVSSTQEVTPIPKATPATFNDPFAYCASVGNADHPGPSYIGEKMPESVLTGMQKIDQIGPDIPHDLLVAGSVWRCMDGKLYACFVGANLPCDAKANTDKTPTSAENDFCKANPDSLSIPAAVTGHETVYDWQCKGTVPNADKVGFHVDPRGYISEIWFMITN